MQTDNKILEDLARLGGGAVHLLASLKQEVERQVKSRLEEFFRKQDLPTREEVEVLRQMVQTLRLEQEALKKQLEALSSAPKTKS